MGAWGYGAFENDDALDWLIELEGSTGLAFVETTLERARGEAIDVWDGCRALAACEIVAAARGAPSPSLPEEASRWLAAQSLRVPDALRDSALAALRAVGADSELKELWDEEDVEVWLATLKELESRLAT